MVDGEPAVFDLRPPAPAEGPPSPADLGVGVSSGGPALLAAALAEHAVCAYTRALERELPPELVITLPTSVQARAAAEAADAAAENAREEAAAAAAAAVTAPGGGSAGGPAGSAGGAPRPGASTGARSAGGGGGGPAASARTGGGGGGGTQQPPALPAAPHAPTPPPPARVHATLRVAYATTMPPTSTADDTTAPTPANAGLVFAAPYAYTSGAPRRARAWFPCIDAPSPVPGCPFELRVTVPPGSLAVASGVLRRVRAAAHAGGGAWRTFAFDVPISCTPAQVALAVGPFRCVRDVTAAAAAAADDADTAARAVAEEEEENGLGGGGGGGSDGEGGQRAATGASAAKPRKHSRPPVTHVSAFGPPEAAHLLAFTAQTLPLALVEYETYLGAPLPGGALRLVAVPGEAGPRPDAPITGAGVILVSSAALFGPRTVGPGLESRLALARAAAAQWFGVLLRPAAAGDGWLADGLAGRLAALFLRARWGKAEAAHRLAAERAAVLAGDDGSAPPLFLGGPPGAEGGCHGSERLDPSPLRAWKAGCVIAMLERRAGDDTFRRVVQRYVADAVAAAAGEIALGAGADEAGGGGGGADAGGVAAAATTAAHLLPAPPTALATARAAGTPPARLLSTNEFLADIARLGGFKRDAVPFYERWVAGGGATAVEGALHYCRRLNRLEVALRQTGSPSAFRTAAKAEAAANAREGSSVGLVRVSVREHAGVADHPVHVGAAPLVLADLAVPPPVRKAGKPGPKRRKPRPPDMPGAVDAAEDPLAAAAAIEEGAAAAAAESEEDEDDAAGERPPILWVRLDPAGEALTSTSLTQPLPFWAAQLERSRDAASQAEAVAGLAAMRPTPPGAVAALAAALTGGTLGGGAVPGAMHGNRGAVTLAHLHCRVRAAAATALGVTAGPETGYRGLSALLSYWSGAACVPGGGVECGGGGRPPAGHAPTPLLRPWRAYDGDPGERVVLAAAARGLALARDAGTGATPPAAVAALCAFVEAGPGGGGGAVDTGGLAAPALAALGCVVPPSPAAALRIARALDKWLARDGSAGGCLPGFQREGVRAALGAAAALAAGAPDRAAAEAGLLPVLARHTRPGVHFAERAAAWAATVTLAAAARGAGAAVGAAAGALAAEPASPPVRAAVLEGLVCCLQSLVAGAGGAADRVLPSLDALAPLYALATSPVAAPSERHLAFMALQAAAGAPPTLFRPELTAGDEEGGGGSAAGGGPSAGGRRPTATGGRSRGVTPPAVDGGGGGGGASSRPAGGFVVRLRAPPGGPPRSAGPGGVATTTAGGRAAGDALRALVEGDGDGPVAAGVAGLTGFKVRLARPPPPVPAGGTARPPPIVLKRRPGEPAPPPPAAGAGRSLSPPPVPPPRPTLKIKLPGAGVAAAAAAPAAPAAPPPVPVPAPAPVPAPPAAAAPTAPPPVPAPAPAPPAEEEPPAKRVKTEDGEGGGGPTRD